MLCVNRPVALRPHQIIADDDAGGNGRNMFVRLLSIEPRIHQAQRLRPFGCRFRSLRRSLRDRLTVDQQQDAHT